MPDRRGPELPSQTTGNDRDRSRTDQTVSNSTLQRTVITTAERVTTVSTHPDSRQRCAPLLEREAKQLADSRLSVRGWSAGHPEDARDTFVFAARRESRRRAETRELADVTAGIARTTNDDTRVRRVVAP